MIHELGKLGGFFLALFGCAILIQVNAKVLTDEEKEQVFTEVKNCMKETGLTDDEFETIIAKKELPTTEAGKCFSKCLMQKMEYIEDGGGVNVVAIQAGLEENMEKKEDVEKAKEIVKACADSIPPEDSCAYAYKISECMYNKMKEAGIPPP